MSEASRRRLIALNNAKDEQNATQSSSSTTTTAAVTGTTTADNAAWRNKREAILKRRFSKRQDESEKPSIQEEPILSSTPVTPPVNERSQSTGRMTPVSGKKLSVARLKKANRGKDAAEQNRSNNSPLSFDHPKVDAKSILTPEKHFKKSPQLRRAQSPVPANSPSIAAPMLSPEKLGRKSPQLQRRESPALTSASSVAAMASRSTDTPRTGSRRRDLVLQRISARKEGSATNVSSSPARSCSPTLRGDAEPNVASPRGRESPIGRSAAVKPRGTRSPSPEMNTARRAVKMLAQASGPNKNHIPTLSTVAQQQVLKTVESNGRLSPFRGTPPRMTHRPTVSPRSSPILIRAASDSAQNGRTIVDLRSRSTSPMLVSREMTPPKQQLATRDRSSSVENRIPQKEMVSYTSQRFRRLPPEVVKNIRARSLGRANQSPHKDMASHSRDGQEAITLSSNEIVEVSEADEKNSSEDPPESLSPKIKRTLSNSSDYRTGVPDPEIEFFVETNDVEQKCIVEEPISAAPTRTHNKALNNEVETSETLELEDAITHTSSAHLRSSGVHDNADGDACKTGPQDDNEYGNRVRVRVDSPSDIRSLGSSDYDEAETLGSNDVTNSNEKAESVLSFIGNDETIEEVKHALVRTAGSDTQEKDLETSWSVNNVYFGDFAEELKEKKETSGVNMFDTDSWVRTEAAFDPVDVPVTDFTTARSCDRSDSADPAQEEKKEKESEFTMENERAHYTLSEHGLEGSSCHASENSVTPSFNVYTADFALDDDQVKSEITHSEAGLTDILGEYDVSLVHGTQLLVSLTNKQSDSLASVDNGIVHDPQREHDSSPQLNALAPTRPLENQSDSGVSWSPGSQSIPWSPGNPPPPPPPGTPSRRKRRTPQRLDKQSPNSLKPVTPAATPRASGSKKAHFFGADYVSKESDDKIELVASLHDYTVRSCELKQADSMSPSRTQRPSPNRNISPVSSTALIQDTKFAEKVDLAISAADSKFEEISEHVEKVGSAEHHASTLMDERTAGAFSTWSNCPSAVTESNGDVGDDRDPPTPSLRDSPVNVHQASVSIASTDSNETSDSIAMNPSCADMGRVEHKLSLRNLLHPSPFEKALERAPQILSQVLAFLGDPVAVCRVKQVSKAFFEYVDENEHKLMRDAVRLGGMSMNIRPSFWLWVTLQKSANLSAGNGTSPRSSASGVRDLELLEREGRLGKWHAVIQRDVARAFGNLPPHKTGARLRTDSIVRALVTWGKNRIMKRGLRGSGDPPASTGIHNVDSDDVSITPTDTVSDWGGVTPAGSFTSSGSGGEARNDRSNERDSVSRKRRSRKNCRPEDLALNGNALTEDMKSSLQDKLSFILHSLAAAHGDVGYCQGMDYVVAHLLRILQDTIRWKAASGTLPSSIRSAPTSYYGNDLDSQERLEMYAEIDRCLVVEETCFRVMDSFFSVYNLRHFYWPELRCLKTCCLVFERLIKIKLPVLADHFEHHELNVGLFALGWFQTLFLYLPSMPSATVCHMWDIWMVERSYKIFFRVGTAILFLSQPILLNHELEGMMSYLNTFPDATLLSPDILIACALQIKVTNRLLMQLEHDITAQM